MSFETSAVANVGVITQDQLDDAVSVASTLTKYQINNILEEIMEVVNDSNAFGIYGKHIKPNAAIFASGIQVGILLAGKRY